MITSSLINVKLLKKTLLNENTESERILLLCGNYLCNIMDWFQSVKKRALYIDKLVESVKRMNIPYFKLLINHQLPIPVNPSQSYGFVLSSQLYYNIPIHI